MSTTPRTINATPESLTSVRSTPGGKRRSATAESCAATQPSPRLPNSRVSNTSRSRSWPSACGRSLVSAQHSNAIAHLSNSDSARQPRTGRKLRGESVRAPATVALSLPHQGRIGVLLRM